jgi:hypothetical protein
VWVASSHCSLDGRLTIVVNGELQVLYINQFFYLSCIIRRDGEVCGVHFWLVTEPSFANREVLFIIF